MFQELADTSIEGEREAETAPLKRSKFSPLIEWTNYMSYLERNYIESEERTSEYLTK